MSAKNLGAAAVIETLEPRLAPAGTVILSTAGGILTVTGDADNNGIRITDVPSTGNWSIADALAGTSYVLNGVAQGAVPFTIPAQNAIKATMGDGNDEFDLFASATPSGMILSGVLSVNLGKGDDKFYLGSAGTQSLQVVGATAVDLGEGADLMQTNLSAVFAGMATLKGGAGNDSFTFLTGGEHVFMKGLSADLGTGSDGFVVVSTRFDVLGGTLSIVGAGTAAMAQTVSLYPDFGICQGVAKIAITAGNVAFKVGTSTSSEFRFGSTLSITTGAGADTAAFNGLVQVAGGVTVDLKDANDSFTLATSAVAILGSLSVKGGNGDDVVTLNTNSILTAVGAFTADLGGGMNLFLSNSGHALTAGTLSVLGGVGNDTVNFAGSIKAFGVALIDLKDGVNEINLDGGFTVGSLAIKAGSGNDDINFLNNSVFQASGLCSLTLGAGTNRFDGSGGSVFSVGALTFTGGVGSDKFTFAGTIFSVLGAVNFTGAAGEGHFDIQSTSYNFVGGALKYTGMAGDDFFLYTGPDNRILGALTLAMGDGNNDSDIQGASSNFGGNVAYTGGTGNDNFFVGAGKFQVVGALTLKMGNGNNFGNFLAISGAIGSVSYVGGTGDDIFYLGNINGTGTTLLTILGAVTATTGDGENTVQLTDTTVHGPVTMQSTSPMDFDVFAVSQSTLNGKTTVNLGSNVSALSVNDSTIRGDFTCNLGAEDDTVNLDASVGTSGVNEWFGKVVINGGAGGDGFTFGSTGVPANRINHFYKTVIVDGGADVDFLTNGSNNTYVVPLVTLNIP